MVNLLHELLKILILFLQQLPGIVLILLHVYAKELFLTLCVVQHTVLLMLNNIIYGFLYLSFNPLHILLREYKHLLHVILIDHKGMLGKIPGLILLDVKQSHQAFVDWVYVLNGEIPNFYKNFLHYVHENKGIFKKIHKDIWQKIFKYIFPLHLKLAREDKVAGGVVLILFIYCKVLLSDFKRALQLNVLDSHSVHIVLHLLIILFKILVGGVIFRLYLFVYRYGE